LSHSKQGQEKKKKKKFKGEKWRVQSAFLFIGKRDKGREDRLCVRIHNLDKIALQLVRYTLGLAKQAIPERKMSLNTAM
jgi:hypothetical protein